MAVSRKGNLVEKTYTLLKKKIITQEIKPGECLDEKRIMEDLGVGRTPLRQAIILLKKDKFVDGQPNKSSYVKEFSLREVKESFETLTIIEKNITYLAVCRITDQELNNVKKVQLNIDKAINEKAFWKITDFNLTFHNLIAQAAKNQFLYEIHKDIRTQTERLSYLAVSNEHQADEDYEDHNQLISAHHKELIKCLTDRDKSKVEEIAVKHVKLFQNRVFKFLTDILYL